VNKQGFAFYFDVEIFMWKNFQVQNNIFLDEIKDCFWV
jgi:hypothetical protein